MIEPRPAATVAVTRDSADGLEVLLLQRTHTAVFMPGAYVFPGGAVDDADRRPLPVSRTGGIDEDAAARMIGVPRDGLAFLLAAIRECFEEAGLLLGEAMPGNSLGGARDMDLAAWRRRVRAGAHSMAELCEHLDLRLHANRMAYLSHWVTPPGPPRRFDTRFFVAPAPPGQTASPDGHEVVDHLWISPREALARHRRGELPLGEPTVHTLETLSGYETTGQLLHRVRAPLAPVEAAGRDGPRLVHPHEPAYAELAKLRDEGLGQGAYEVIPGVARRLSQRVTRLTAPNPGAMTGPGTNTYLVGSGGELAVIDPGPALAVHVDAITAAAGGAVRWILATHTHPDHSPSARELQRRTGAPILGMPPPDAEGQDATFRPDRVLGHGERLRVGDATLRTIHTPGHASNHLCYLLEEEGLLFSGDHIMQGSTVVIGPPDGDMKDYLAALDALRSEPIAYIAPGHGFLMGDPHAVIDRIVAHRLTRERKVMDGIRRLGRTSESELLAAVYDDVPGAMHGVAARSLRAHLLKLRDEGAVLESGDLWGPVV